LWVFPEKIKPSLILVQMLYVHRAEIKKRKDKKMTIKEALKHKENGKRVKFTLEWNLGKAGTIPQSLEVKAYHNEISLRHEIACLKLDNKPYTKARFEIID
jgi:hypothetical protein